MSGLLHKMERCGLCLGCGLCESVFGHGTCRVELGPDGYFHPNVTDVDEALLEKICPGIHEVADAGGKVWGNVEMTVQAWAADAMLRHESASGGAVSALLIHALSSGKADAVLQVGTTDGLSNELKISRTAEQVKDNAGSRYAPAALFKNIKEILESGKERYAFVGKPCDIAALENFLAVFPEFASRFVVKIAIFCAGIPSHLAARQLAARAGKGEPKSIRFRGNGWPGNFVADFEDGTSISMSYEESWGSHLGRNLAIRCKICPDGIGLLADVAVGDSWNLVDGKPDFKEDEGRSVCLVRSSSGMELLEGARTSGLIETTQWSLDKLALQQPYQYRRRLASPVRMAPVRLFFGRKFRMMGMSVKDCTLRPGEVVKELRGSARRVLVRFLKRNR